MKIPLRVTSSYFIIVCRLYNKVFDIPYSSLEYQRENSGTISFQKYKILKSLKDTS